MSHRSVAVTPSYKGGKSLFHQEIAEPTKTVIHDRLLHTLLIILVKGHVQQAQ